MDVLFNSARDVVKDVIDYSLVPLIITCIMVYSIGGMDSMVMFISGVYLIVVVLVSSITLVRLADD